MDSTGAPLPDAAFPDAATLRTVLGLAGRAPSVRNVQPWRWRVGAATLELIAAPGPQPAGPGTGGRGPIVSCGIALHHCVVALAALGWQARVHRLPDPADGSRLASIEVSPRETDQVDVALAAAIPRRRTDRRCYSDWPVSVADVALMGARAARAGVMLRQVDARDQLTAVVARAVGVAPEADRAVVLALGTEADDRLAWLRAGEATSVVLLTATALGLAGCPVTEPLELRDIHTAVRRDVFGASGFPQLLLRVGWPPINADPLPPTPRRPLDDTVEWLVDPELVEDRDEACV